MKSDVTSIRILCVEDVAADAELELRELKRAGLRVVHKIADTEQRFIAELREFAPEVILSDFSMPGFDGMSALALARELAPGTPFIFVSGTIGEEYAIRALKNGATDYVLKTNLIRLPAAVERALADARQRAQQRRIEAELETARERLAGIIDSLPDVLWSVELPGENIIYLGPASKEIFGRDADDFLVQQDLWIDVVHPEDRPAVLAAWRALVAENRPFDVEYRVVRPDGSERWVNDRGHVVRKAGISVRIDGVARDVTEQVEHRERIGRLSRIRELLGTLSSAIVRVRERNALFQEFCRIAVSHGGFVLARIIERDGEGKARLAATTERDTAVFQALLDAYNRDPESSDALFARAFRTGEVVVSNDVANDPRAPKGGLLTREGNYSLALLPVIVEGRVASLVVLRAREPGFFDQEELRLLSEMVSNITFALELMAKQGRIAYLAHYDALTGLPNRVLFDERLKQAIEEARSAGRAVTLVVLDLERFKGINDALGPHIGDRVLQALARRMESRRGGIERIARLGGNVFASILPESADELERRLEPDMARFFGPPFEVDGQEIRLNAKLGIASFPRDGADAASLFRNAEASLRHAKETGEPFLFYAPHINARAAEQRELENRLRKAVEQRELFLHYQPKLDLVTKRIVGLEALMRWQAPDGGLVSPAKFIPVLEQTGLILEAGRQAIAAASLAYRTWHARGLNAPRVAVNVSAVQLRRRNFVEDVQLALGAGVADGGGVDLEITESLLMSAVEDSTRKLRELRELGLRIALDDFGTGYSSLAYLSKLPLDSLKIDRSFVHGMTENADHTSIITAIISLAQALKLKVVAEGVETEEQAQLLRLLRCEQAQGYLFSPPVPAERIEALLASATG